MAGDWIKMRGNLWDDPRVTRLADETDQPEAMIVGGLYWLWATADQHSSDGTLEGMTLRAIDRKTGIKGFGDALVLIGWLVENATGVTVSRFEEHNGASAKARVQTAKRVANHKGNAKVTQAPLPETDQTVSDALPREREEKEEPKPFVASATDGSPDGQDKAEGKGKPEPSEEDRKAALWLADVLKKANPQCRAPKIERWAREIRLLREVDGRTHRQICELFQWAKSDKFWAPNIQSPAKLREKWDTLAERRDLALPAPAAAPRPDLKDVL